MSKYAKVIVLACVLGAVITAGTYMVATKKETVIQPNCVELCLTGSSSTQEITRGFPYAYYWSKSTKASDGFDGQGRFKDSTNHATGSDHKALGRDFLTWTLASFLVLFLILRPWRKHA